jgi:hypothetical protein
MPQSPIHFLPLFSSAAPFASHRHVHVIIVTGCLELLKTQFAVYDSQAVMQVGFQQHPGGPGVFQKKLQ